MDKQINVSIGQTTDGDRVVGFQPPLTEGQIELIQECISQMPVDVIRLCTPPEPGSSYTELRLNTGNYHSDWSDGIAVSLAKRAAGILSQSGEHVAPVDESINTVGWGKYLFGSEVLESA